MTDVRLALATLGRWDAVCAALGGDVTTVRLAAEGQNGKRRGFLREDSDVTDVRLVAGQWNRDHRALQKGLSKPDVRLAHCPGAQGDNVLAGQRGVDQLPEGSLPALLVSWYYYEQFAAQRDRFHFRDWALDSGAYSAKNAGAVIDLAEYTDACARLLAEDEALTEVFALDVIGDHEASLRNTEEMWRQGVPAIPAYHIGSPEEALKEIAARYPKIALGGVAKVKGRTKLDWAEQCFARVWPKRVHGFGFGTAEALERLPWHSVDSTSWELGPCAYGRWVSYGGSLPIWGSDHNLRSEVEYYLRAEADARVRWRREMKQLEEIEP